MHRFEEHAQHLLTVMLGEALELHCFARDPALDVPGSHIARLPEPDVLHQVGKRFRQAATRTQRVLPIEVLPVDLEEEEFDERLCVRQALQHRVHEARIAQVLHARQSYSALLTREIEKRGEWLLHECVGTSLVRNLLHLLWQTALLIGELGLLLHIGLRIVCEGHGCIVVEGDLPLDDDSFVVGDVDVLDQLVRLQHTALNLSRHILTVK